MTSNTYDLEYSKNTNYYFNNTTPCEPYESCEPCKPYEPCKLYDPNDNLDLCTRTMIGSFVCTEPYGIGFIPLYITGHEDNNKCYVRPKQCKETIKVDVSSICLKIEYGMIYKILYKRPSMSKQSKYTPILKIVSVTKLLIYNYEGIIRRYTLNGTDMYYVELPNKHQIKILNPEKLMPIRVTKPTNLGTCGTSLTTVTNNYTYYEKVILQGASFDDVVDCKCNRRYMHIYNISYYDKR
jgi:hypothetical protein